MRRRILAAATGRTVLAAPPAALAARKSHRVEIRRTAVPRGQALLSYSQPENPTPPHYADQTRLYSQKQWLPMRFTERQIRSGPEYERTMVTGRR